MLVFKIGNVGFKIGNFGFKNQKFWDGGKYFSDSETIIIRKIAIIASIMLEQNSNIGEIKVMGDQLP